MTTGQRLRKARGEMSQTTLSEVLGVSKAQISYLENDKSGFSVDLAVRIANACHVSLDWLLTGRENPRLMQKETEDFITVSEEELFGIYRQLDLLKDKK